jgi:hypothetical protein
MTDPESKPANLSHPVEIDIDLCANERVEILIEFKPGEEPPAIEQVRKRIDTPLPAFKKPRRPGLFSAQVPRLQRALWERRSFLPQALFVFALLIYLATRLIQIDQFPIYFFCDEAINPVLAADLVRDNYQDFNGQLLPTFFKNGGQYCLGPSVYLQIIPLMMFGKTVWATRSLFAIISVLAALWVGLSLRDHLKHPLWWAGPLLLAIVPAWFIHSRAAFEYSLMVTFYAGFLYYYLHFRKTKPNAIYPALILGGLAFYAYTPGQIVVVVTGLLLLIVDVAISGSSAKSPFPLLVC